MDSLYGGIPGAPFIIKYTYKSIDEMIEDFNTSSANVYYGEYCLINTTNNLNSPDNGKLYQRQHGIEKKDNDNNEYEAKYIGQIVGPQSGTPNMQIVNAATLLGYYNDEEFYNSNIDTVSWTGTTAQWSDGKVIDGENTFYSSDHKFKYAWLCHRNDGNNTAITTLYVAIQLPTPDIQITQISGYNSSGLSTGTSSAKATYSADSGMVWDITLTQPQLYPIYTELAWKTNSDFNTDSTPTLWNSNIIVWSGSSDKSDWKYTISTDPIITTDEDGKATSTPKEKTDATGRFLCGKVAYNNSEYWVYLGAAPTFNIKYAITQTELLGVKGNYQNNDAICSALNGATTGGYLVLYDKTTIPLDQIIYYDSEGRPTDTTDDGAGFGFFIWDTTENKWISLGTLGQMDVKYFSYSAVKYYNIGTWGTFEPTEDNSSSDETSEEDSDN